MTQPTAPITSDWLVACKTTSEVRSLLAKCQVEVVNSILSHWKDCGEWMPVRVLHVKFEKEKALQILRSLGSSIVQEMDDYAVNNRYRLTAVGVLVGSHGQYIEDMLIRYLSYIRERFIKNPELISIKSDDVQEVLQFESSDLELLGKMILMAPFLPPERHDIWPSRFWWTLLGKNRTSS